MTGERIAGWLRLGQQDHGPPLPGRGWRLTGLADCIRQPPRLLCLSVAPGHEAMALDVAEYAVRAGPWPVLVSAQLAPAERAALLGLGRADCLGPDALGREWLLRARRLLAHPRVRAGRMRFDTVHQQVSNGAERSQLTPREAALLAVVLAAGGKPVPTEQLWRDVLGFGFDPGTNGLAVHLHRLRAKLAAIGIFAIRTDRGAGYALDRAALGLPPLDRVIATMSSFSVGIGESEAWKTGSPSATTDPSPRFASPVPTS
mgnify:CR=1 FL=1